ncbi:MAG: T9SS type A sorting domain-containing protein [Chitinophagaceae bacterium]
MKRILFILALTLTIATAKAQLTQQSYVTPDGHGTIYFYQFKPPHYRTGSPKNPLIISLHGGGEGGSGSPSDLSRLVTAGIPKKINDGVTNMEFTYNGYTDGFVVLAPQIPPLTDWQNYYVDEMIAYGIANLNVDPNRIFLTGYSIGGTGAWAYATGSSANAAKLAGVAPIAGKNPGGGYCNIASQQLATWAFSAASDDYAGTGTQDAANSVNACGTLIVPAISTTFPYTVHGTQVWDVLAYDVTNNTHYPNLFQWMLKVSRALNPSTNQNPNPVAILRASGVSAQGNVTLNLPVTFKNLQLIGDQATDPDDIIVDYLWAQTAGPYPVYMGSYYNHQTGTTTEQWPNTAIADATNNYSIKMMPGTYQFQLRVKDYLTSKPGHTQYGTINLTVQYPPGFSTSAPAVDAGTSRTITTNSDKQQGQAEAYPCGSGCNISNYQWSIISFPAGASPQLHNYNGTNYSNGSPQAAFDNLTVDGAYTFRFTVTNSVNQSNSDDLVITRQTSSALPVNYAYINAANSGNNNVINWATTSEINSDRFDVQRSIDGLSFSTIGSVQSVGGATTTEYHFTDENAPAGLSYYRLSQVDKDGKTALSKVVSVNNKKAGIYIERYPNPVRESMNVTVQSINNGTIQVSIADMQGKTLIQQQWQKDQPQLKKIINVAALQAGMYQMVITMGQERKVSSFVKY